MKSALQFLFVLAASLSANWAMAQAPNSNLPDPQALAGNVVVVDDTFCLGDSGFVYVVPDTSRTYTWYDAQNGGSQVGTGDTLWTGPITSTTSYWLEGQAGGSSSYSVGPTSNAIAGGSNYTFEPDGIVFTVNSACTIDTVFVYPNGPGNVRINIENSAQVNIFSVTVPVTTSGTKTAIPVGYTIAPGTGYRMHNVGSTNGGLFRNTGGASFPYTSPPINITGSINGSTTFYYKFYDWKVSSGPAPDPRVAATAVVNPLPIVDLGPDQNYCGNGAPCTVLVPTITGAAGPFGFDWMPGTGLNDSTIQNPCAAPTASTDYQVLVTDLATGCSGLDTISMNVPQPYQSGLPSDTSTCAGDTITICANMGNGVTYLWSTGETTNCISPSSGPIILNATDSLGCSTIDTVNLLVTPQVMSDFSIDTAICPTISFTDLSTDALPGWSWDFGDGGSASSPNPSHTYTSNGTYDVMLITSNACSSDTLIESLTISCLVGTDLAFENDFKLYPNPTTGSFRLQSLQPGIASTEIVIYTAQGRLIKHLDATDLSQGLVIDLSQETDGIYFVELRSEGKVWHASVLIRR